MKKTAEKGGAPEAASTAPDCDTLNATAPSDSADAPRNRRPYCTGGKVFGLAVLIHVG